MSTGGRGVCNKKTRVDEARSIDILDLQRKEVFTKGSTWSWTSSWSRNGEVVASISYRVESGDNGPAGLRFMYTITENETGEKKDYNYIIPVVSTRCNYGGKRWWFICPLVVNGRVCQRRCRIVYLPPGTEYFGCRECHQLTYERAGSGTGKSFMKGSRNLIRRQRRRKKSLPRPDHGQRKRRSGGNCHALMPPLRVLKVFLPIEHQR